MNNLYCKYDVETILVRDEAILSTIMSLFVPLTSNMKDKTTSILDSVTSVSMESESLPPSELWDLVLCEVEWVELCEVEWVVLCEVEWAVLCKVEWVELCKVEWVELCEVEWVVVICGG